MTDPPPAPAAAACADQRLRWGLGERVSVEAYLDRQPALRADPEAVLNLIYNEVVLRGEAGERPGLDEYLRRFPELAEDLRVQFELDSALATHVLADADRPATPVAAAEPALPQVPGYEVEGVLGRGGMGVV